MAAKWWRQPRKPRDPPGEEPGRLSEPIIIALDAMGGDHAPDMVVKGAGIADPK